MTEHAGDSNTQPRLRPIILSCSCPFRCQVWKLACRLLSPSLTLLSQPLSRIHGSKPVPASPTGTTRNARVLPGSYMPQRMETLGRERGWGGNCLTSTTASTASETVPQRAEGGACCCFTAEVVPARGTHARSSALRGDAGRCGAFHKALWTGSSHMWQVEPRFNRPLNYAGS